MWDTILLLSTVCVTAFINTDIWHWLILTFSSSLCQQMYDRLVFPPKYAHTGCRAGPWHLLQTRRQQFGVNEARPELISRYTDPVFKLSASVAMFTCTQHQFLILVRKRRKGTFFMFYLSRGHPWGHFHCVLSTLAWYNPICFWGKYQSQAIGSNWDNSYLRTGWSYFTLNLTFAIHMHVLSKHVIKCKHFYIHHIDRFQGDFCALYWHCYGLGLNKCIYCWPQVSHNRYTLLECLRAQCLAPHSFIHLPCSFGSSYA